MDFFKLSKIKRPENEMMKGGSYDGLCFLLVLLIICSRVNQSLKDAGSLFMDGWNLSPTSNQFLVQSGVHTFFHSSHNGCKVVVQQYHICSLLGYI